MKQLYFQQIVILIILFFFEVLQVVSEDSEKTKSDFDDCDSQRAGHQKVMTIWGQKGYLRSPKDHNMSSEVIKRSLS